MADFNLFQKARWSIRSLIVAVLLLICACGYRLVGSGELPSGINTLAVTVLTNRTAETGLETTVTNALIDEFTRRRQDLVVSVKDADAILSGTIESLSTETLTRSNALTAEERRLTIVASLTLKDQAGKVVWQRQQLAASQAYAVAAGDQSPLTEQNRRQAIGLVAQRFAEEVYQRLTDTF